MSHSPHDHTSVDTLVGRAVQRLQNAGSPTAFKADFVPAKRRWWGTKSRPTFTNPQPVWPLGVLLLTPTGQLFAATEQTRAVPPGHPGHTSAERERRRMFTAAAYRSGLAEGSVVYFNAALLPASPAATQPEGSPLVWPGGEPHVRWSRAPGTQPVDLATYLDEHIDLSIS